jgi:hypothetical protein
MTINMNVRDLIAKTPLFSDGEAYLMIKLPASAITVAAGIVAEIGDPFAALIIDKDEVSLVVPHEAVDEFGTRLRGHVASSMRYRLITFDIELPHDIVGYLAPITTALAAAGISILAFAAYTRDHVLVPEDRYADALRVIEALKQG